MGKRSARLWAASFCACLCAAPSARAQYTPQAITNPVITLTAQAAGTVNSAKLLNPNGLAATCVFNQSAHTGTVGTTIAIQGLDPGGSGNWYTIVTSASVALDATPTPISAGKGVQTTASPPPATSSLPVPTTWRVQAVVGTGVTPAVTGTVGCILN